MNALRNKVQLIGNLGNDPIIKDLDNGQKLLKFSLATNEYYHDKEGEKVEKTEWHNIIAWGKTAETMEALLTKGNEVVVSGKLTHRSYEDKDGISRNVSEVVVNEFVKLNRKVQA